jgi:hypothetical protein
MSEDPTQDTAAVRAIAEDVAKVLTPNESIVYVATQNLAAMTVKPDAAVATTNRLILYRPSVMGRVEFQDVQWQDVRNARISQGVLSTAFALDTVDGRTLQMSELAKEQAKRLYAVAQQMEQEWREKRRVREMEEARAKSGGVVLGSGPLLGGAPAAGEDPAARLARAKQMLDQGLISETEYDALKARILNTL